MNFLSLCQLFLLALVRTHEGYSDSWLVNEVYDFSMHWCLSVSADIVLGFGYLLYIDIN